MCLGPPVSGSSCVWDLLRPGFASCLETPSPVSRDLTTPSVPGHAGPVKRPAGAHSANQRGDGQADPLQLPQGRVSAFP